MTNARIPHHNRSLPKTVKKQPPIIKTLATLTLLFFATVTFGQQADYSRIKAEAERFYAEKSYSKAYELYQQAANIKLPPDDARWVSFRLADTQWRAESATTTPDSTKFDQAREK